jgi:hypothetical protein
MLSRIKGLDEICDVALSTPDERVVRLKYWRRNQQMQGHKYDLNWGVGRFAVDGWCLQLD